MKKILILLTFLASVSTSLVTANGWPAGTVQQAIKTQIRMNCLQILETYGRRGSAAPVAIYQYLASIGTPESFEILKEFVAGGVVPERYLPK